MEILTAFVREHTHWIDRPIVIGKFWRRLAMARLILLDAWRSIVQVDRSSFWAYQPPRADVQAALTVIGRRRWTYQKGEQLALDLRETDLRHTRLEGAHLEGINLALAHLEGAWLRGAHLQQANLVFAQLRGAQLEGADLQQARGLTWDQIRSTNGYEQAHLPDYLE